MARGKNEISTRKKTITKAKLRKTTTVALVKSHTDPTKKYTTCIGENACCSCLDWWFRGRHTGKYCKHQRQLQDAKDKQHLQDVVLMTI